MKFDRALTLIRSGNILARRAWEGTAAVYLVKGSKIAISQPPLIRIYPNDKMAIFQPHINMRHEDGTLLPWNNTQADILASDWFVITENEEVSNAT